MHLSVVLCTYNRAASLRTALESFEKIVVPEGFEWELLLVDNNSDDDTREVAEAAADRLPLRYFFEGRQGKSFALNTGVHEATGEVVAFTDDDVVVHSDWVAATWRAFQEYECDGIGGRVIPTWDFERPSWMQFDGKYQIMSGVIVSFDFGDEVRPPPVLPFGANMAFRRRVFDEAGLFDTTIGPAGRSLALGEDTEFCRRVREKGGTYLYIPDAVIFHPVEPKRATKRYCLDWYHAFGKSTVQRGIVFEGRWWIFGVPARLFVRVASSALRWISALNGERRFYYRLRTVQHAGQIAGYLNRRG